MIIVTYLCISIMIMDTTYCFISYFNDIMFIIVINMCCDRVNDIPCSMYCSVIVFVCFRKHPQSDRASDSLSHPAATQIIRDHNMCH